MLPKGLSRSLTGSAERSHFKAGFMQRLPEGLLGVMVGLLTASCLSPAAGQGNLRGAEIFQLNQGVQSRAISFENITGEVGAGGKAASKLGPGRKGSPKRTIGPGESVTLCDITGPGTIRHIWMTGNFGKDHSLVRSVVLRGWWDDQQHPSIECPIGDFMGVAHAKVTPYQSAVHSVGEKAAFNFWIPMPFTKRAKLSFDNESASSVTLYYQIDYTVGDQHDNDTGRLHTLFSRQNPTTQTVDFELLPKRTGRGRFLGAVIGVRSFQPAWWGEGEVKMYVDGDKEYPTIAGTGAEDYVGLSYGVQETPYLYHGCTLDREGFINMYRWHLLDPIYWSKDIRVTIQQIGYDKKRGYFERQDDWSTATFWYEPVPSAPLPEFPSLAVRTADMPSFSLNLEDKATTTPEMVN